MQTFVPYPDMPLCAFVLDDKRLGKQRVETLQILNALHGLSKGWVNHPATRMWKGYSNALVEYGVYICHAWIDRGFQDTCLEKIQAFHNSFTKTYIPPWWGQGIHTTHRAALLHKDYTFYSKYNWEEKPERKYHWPV